MLKIVDVRTMQAIWFVRVLRVTKSARHSPSCSIQHLVDNSTIAHSLSRVNLTSRARTTQAIQHGEFQHRFHFHLFHRQPLRSWTVFLSIQPHENKPSWMFVSSLMSAEFTHQHGASQNKKPGDISVPGYFDASVKTNFS